MRFKWSVLLLVTWTVTLLVAVLVAANDKAKWFDPDNKLHQAALSISFDDVFLDELKQVVPTITGSVIHFQSNNCFCQTVAQSHIYSIEKLAAQKQLQNVKLNLDEHTAFKAYIPSVPAVAVIEKNGKLSYLGPYSTGMFCSQGNGLVEPFLKKSQNNTIAATVISQSQGCYCNLTEA